MPSDMTNAFYTVGHSDRLLSEFVALLQAAGVELVVDVRAFPRSRGNPQFNADELERALAGFAIFYAHIPALGGRRPRQAAVPPARNAFWENRSFHNYADYAESAAFRAGLERLTELGRRQRCAIMCAEAVWWRCHRRIIADYLISRGERVFHILPDGRIERAKRTPGARRRRDGTLAYPAAAPV
jgi:uncharacterized protein (DUF488 family)